MTVITMETGSRAAAWRLWAGRALSGLTVLFLLLDGGAKLAAVPQVVETTVDMGYPAGVVRGLGVLILAIAALYAVPRTAVWGAVLLTGLLGGAIASNVRLEDPLFSHTLFGLYVGVVAWGGLFLRDDRVRAFVFGRARAE